MTPAQVVRRAAGYLERHGVDAPLATAELLLASILETDRAGLYARRRVMGTTEAKAFGRLLCQRCGGTPTQHLTGETGFRSLTVTVRPGVFVPRPETEVVVDAALEAVRDVASPVIVDVGTGAGVIALSMKQERPDARVWAVDRSSEAIELASLNAARNGLEIELQQADMLTGLPRTIVGCVDLVVANPPYIEPEAYEALPPEVRADPIEALVGGLDVYQRLFEQAGRVLASAGAVVVEIEETRGPAVAALAAAAGASVASVAPDLIGRDRVVVARWP
jgi:release factor glutamine methyltransferase